MIKGFLADHTVAVVINCVTKAVTACLPIVGQDFKTLIVASNKEWLQEPSK